MHILSLRINGQHVGYLSHESTRACQRIYKEKTYAKTYVAEQVAIKGAAGYTVACPVEGGVYVAVPKETPPNG